MFDFIYSAAAVNNYVYDIYCVPRELDWSHDDLVFEGHDTNGLDPRFD